MIVYVKKNAVFHVSTGIMKHFAKIRFGIPVSGLWKYFWFTYSLSFIPTNGKVCTLQ